MEGAARSGVSAAAAQAVYQTLEGFALYGFCKSHALSFARLTYLSAWLKRHEHAAITAALLNIQPMGFYSPESLVEDAKRHGVEVLPADINQSEERCTLEKGAVRLGLKLVQGLSEALCDRILQRRAQQGGFASLRDVYQCCQPKLRVAESLVEAGVFDGFGLERRELLWQLWILDRERQVGPSLFDLPCQVPPLPKADVWALMRGEFQSLGISLQGHPMLYLRPYVKGCDSRDLRKSQAGTALQISGMVTCRQRPPTAKGFAFLTLEDEYGMINLVIAPKIYERDRRIFRQAAFITAFGHVDARDAVINLRVHHLAEIQEKTRQITP
jgi:error-prone DNA polymerase